MTMRTVCMIEDPVVRCPRKYTSLPGMKSAPPIWGRGRPLQCPSAERRDDAEEVGRLQAGAADQRAIDIFDRHQSGGIGGLDRAAIEQPDPSGLRRHPG